MFYSFFGVSKVRLNFKNKGLKPLVCTSLKSKTLYLDLFIPIAEQATTAKRDKKAHLRLRSQHLVDCDRAVWKC
jgi:hypothetical protein